MKPETRIDWSEERIADLGYRAGRGDTAAQIAGATGRTPMAIYSAVRRFGLKLLTRPHGTRAIIVFVPDDAVPAIEAAASKRGIDAADLLARFADVVREEGPGFLDAVLDDGGRP